MRQIVLDYIVLASVRNNLWDREIYAILKKINTKKTKSFLACFELDYLISFSVLFEKIPTPGLDSVSLFNGISTFVGYRVPNPSL